MIASRKRALDELWLDYGITAQGPLDLDDLFGRQAPCYLEIGFGMGETLLEMARSVGADFRTAQISPAMARRSQIAGRREVPHPYSMRPAGRPLVRPRRSRSRGAAAWWSRALRSWSTSVGSRPPTKRGSATPMAFSYWK